MRSLNWCINDSFRYGGRVSLGNLKKPITEETKKYLEIPLNRDVIEIPLFFIKPFEELIDQRKDNIDKIIIELCYIGLEPSYKTLSRYMLDVIRADYNSKLTKCTVKRKGENYNYYATGGIITDSNFNPILISGWQLSRDWSGEEYTYKVIKPFFRISPIILEQKDSMQNFIIKKVIPELFIQDLKKPYFIPTEDTSDYYSINVEIGNKCVPIAKVVDKPSISLNNDTLIQLAIANVNNMEVI